VVKVKKKIHADGPTTVKGECKLAWAVEVKRKVHAEGPTAVKGEYE
jgi:hypothetical protein